MTLLESLQLRRYLELKLVKIACHGQLRGETIASVQNSDTENPQTKMLSEERNRK